MSQVAPPVLQYAEPEPVQQSRRAQLIWLALSIPALVVPFLDFTWRTSPWDVVQELKEFPAYSQWEWEITALAVSFFIAFPIVAWKARLLYGRPSAREIRWASILGIAMCAPLVVFIAGTMWRFDGDSFHPTEMVRLWVIPLIVLALALVVTWRVFARATSASAVETLLIAPYLSNAALCLGVFWWSDEIGFALTIFVVIVWTAQLVLAAISTWKRA